MIARLLGWIFLFAAGAVLVRDGLAWHDLHIVNLESFSSLWFDLSSGSFGVFRGQVLSILPWLWTMVMAPILNLWAGPALLVAALLLFWTGRQGHRAR